jgi:hypothetical protein
MRTLCGGARELSGFVVDFDGYLRQRGRILPVVMCTEQQFQESGEQDPDVSPGAAAVTAVCGGQRGGEGLGSVRFLALLLALRASGPEFASAHDVHLPQSSAFSTPSRAAVNGKTMVSVVALSVAMAGWNRRAVCPTPGEGPPRVRPPAPP